MILCVGTSHRFASVRVLEHANREAAALRDAFESAVAGQTSTFPFNELVVLATCNRVEFYAACEPAAAQRAIALLRTALEGSGETTQHYVHRGRNGLRHLCRVAAGLDSMVLGEFEIAGQVSRAFEGIVHADSKPLLTHAVAVARKAGRRARAETGIARGPLSMSSVSIRLIAERLGALQDRRVLVLGAGKMSTATCEVLRTSGAQVTVANRTLSNAEALAARVGARALSLDTLTTLLAESDAVIASTGSPVALITPQVVEQALQRRQQSSDPLPLLLIDIAVPCDVADEVRGMNGVEVIGIDDLRTRISAHLDERRAEVPRVEAIIEEELTRFASKKNLRLQEFENVRV